LNRSLTRQITSPYSAYAVVSSEFTNFSFHGSPISVNGMPYICMTWLVNPNSVPSGVGAMPMLRTIVSTESV
jgi:hypothetical protein